MWAQGEGAGFSPISRLIHSDSPAVRLVKQRRIQPAWLVLQQKDLSPLVTGLLTDDGAPLERDQRVHSDLQTSVFMFWFYIPALE